MPLRDKCALFGQDYYYLVRLPTYTYMYASRKVVWNKERGGKEDVADGRKEGPINTLIWPTPVHFNCDIIHEYIRR